jgi:outer membrane protein assembly factor BamD
LAPQAQMDIGAAREKQKEYPEAVKAYELAADRYSDQKPLAADALYKAAQAYNKQARKADYDQSVAGQAISAFTDFMALYPDDPRAADSIKIIANLRAEEARGNFKIAQYYEKEKRWDGARVYYNAVYNELRQDPGSPLAKRALERLEFLKNRTSTPVK